MEERLRNEECPVYWQEGGKEGRKEADNKEKQDSQYVQLGGC